MFNSRLIHLDLKGAPLKPCYLKSVFPLMKKWGATGLCIEWEDMLPFEGRFRILRNRSAYSRKDVAAILDAAKNNGLTVVPLIQTFGHLEFLLKHEQFAGYREDPDSMSDICPAHNGSLALIRELIDQVIELHPGIEAIHLGGDEVWSLGSNPMTKKLVEAGGKDAAYLHHMLPLVDHVNSQGLRAMIWDDMMREWPVKSLRKLAGKADLVVWRYGDSIDAGLPHDMWKRFSASGVTMWGASAFKGACGADAIWPDFHGRIRNHHAWVERGRKTSLAGLILTGWSRYNHYAILCELLPTALPALALCLEVLNRGQFKDSMRRKVFRALGVGDMPFLHKKTEDIISIPTGKFPGGKVFRLIGKLQGARTLMWFVNDDLQNNFPKRNGGRCDKGRARKMFRRSEWAIKIAGQVLKELPAALEPILMKPDIKELIDVQIKQMLTAARIGRAEAVRVLRQ